MQYRLGFAGSEGVVMVGNLISQVVDTPIGSPAFQLMAPAIEKAIQFCFIAAFPLGGCLGWVTGEVIRRALIANKQGIVFHLLNALTGIVGFLLGAYISFQRGPRGSVLIFAILSSVALVLIVRFCTHMLVGSPKMRK